MRWTRFAIVLIAILFLTPSVCTRAFAQEPSDNGFPMKHSQEWSGELSGLGGAVAECTLESEDSFTCHFNIEAHGLKPDGLYSFWLRGSSDQEMGLGSDPFTAQADSRGRLTYRSLQNFCPETRNVNIIVKDQTQPQSVITLEGTITRQ